MAEEKTKKGIHTISEIESQADSWVGVIKRIDKKENDIKALFDKAEEILFTGCGSAFNISNAVAPICQKITGKTSRPVHASDLMINPDSFLNPGKSTLVIDYSRSGDTTESVAALFSAKKANASTISITCFADCKMAKMADVAFVLEEAVEKSVATTRSLTAMVLSGYYIAAKFANNKSVCEQLKTLPDIGRERMVFFHELGRKIGNDEQIKKYAFLGSGSYYGLAREAQLKIKEMVLLPSDSYLSLDYQHGPMSNVDENMLVTIMVSDAGEVYDFELAENMKKLGGKVLILCDKDNLGFNKVADYVLELNTTLGDGIRDILYMPTIQFMAYYRSLSVGCDPDKPNNLFYYVKLNSGIE